MNKYLVVTPPYKVIEDVVVDGRGPWCQVADTIEVVADNADDAVSVAVGAMLEDKKFQWCALRKEDGLDPFEGVKAFDYNIMGNMVDELEPNPTAHMDLWLNEGDMVEPSTSEANAMDPEWILNFEEPPPSDGGWDEDS